MTCKNKQFKKNINEALDLITSFYLKNLQKSNILNANKN